ncbi:MAG: hypothetical protein RBU21_14440, partial [FCB group bacterium]|nr:hypothetical protein [FCB group bacterium]
MSIRVKMALLSAMSLAALVALMAFGGFQLTQLQKSMNGLVQREFLPLIDEDVLPLLNGEVQALVNEDFPSMARYSNSWILMLEADRDVHQALIAEKDALGAITPEAIAQAGKDNEENIGQAEERMKKAAEVFTTDDVKAMDAEFQKAFAVWKQASSKHVAGAADKANPPATTDAGGDASDFQTMRSLIDGQQAGVENELGAIQTKVQGSSELDNQRSAHIQE